MSTRVEAERCACGALREVIDVRTMGQANPSYLSGQHIEPCTCPVCAGCLRVLVDGRCTNMDCWAYNVLVPAT